MHEDHIGGFYALMNQESALKCPVFIHEKEWIFRQERYSKMTSPLREIMNFLEQHVHLISEDRIRLNNFEFQWTGGHTPGHMTVLLHGKNQTFCYPGDLLPTSSHLRPERIAYAWDRHKYRIEKEMLINRALEEKWIIGFSHAPYMKFAILDKSEENGYIVCQTKMQETRNENPS